MGSFNGRCGELKNLRGAHESIAERFAPADNDDGGADPDEDRAVHDLREKRFFFHGVAQLTAELNSLV